MMNKQELTDCLLNLVWMTTVGLAGMLFILLMLLYWGLSI